MHDLDELKRQWDQAKSRRVQAEDAEREAEHRYAEAACAKLRADLDAQGFTEGAKVRVGTRRLFGEGRHYSIPVAVGPVKWDYYRPSLTFYRLKADGTPGRARAAIHFDPPHDILKLASDGDPQ